MSASNSYDPTYGSPVYGAWREHAREPWQRYTRHAFVEGIADGTLAHTSFVYYLVQDYVFLMHYARAWALAVVKAETREEMQLASSIGHSSVMVGGLLSSAPSRQSSGSGIGVPSSVLPPSTTMCSMSG